MDTSPCGQIQDAERPVLALGLRRPLTHTGALQCTSKRLPSPARNAEARSSLILRILGRKTTSLARRAGTSRSCSIFRKRPLERRRSISRAAAQREPFGSAETFSRSDAICAFRRELSMCTVSVVVAITRPSLALRKAARCLVAILRATRFRCWPFRSLCIVRQGSFRQQSTGSHGLALRPLASRNPLARAQHFSGRSRYSRCVN